MLDTCVVKRKRAKICTSRTRLHERRVRQGWFRHEELNRSLRGVDVGGGSVVRRIERSRAKQLRLVESTGLGWRTARPNCQENCSPGLTVAFRRVARAISSSTFHRCVLSCAMKQKRARWRRRKSNSRKWTSLIVFLRLGFACTPCRVAPRRAQERRSRWLKKFFAILRAQHAALYVPAVARCRRIGPRYIPWARNHFVLLTDASILRLKRARKSTATLMYLTIHPRGI